MRTIAIILLCLLFSTVVHAGDEEPHRSLADCEWILNRSVRLNVNEDRKLEFRLISEEIYNTLFDNDHPVTPGRLDLRQLGTR